MNTKWISLLVLTVLLAAPAGATLVFDPAVLSGAPGAVLSFQGTVENNWGEDTFLVALSLTLEGFSETDIDLMPFLLNAPLDPLASGASAGPFEWFTVTIPAVFAPGSYVGQVSLLGGPNADSQNLLDIAEFRVGVTGDPTVVPEPAFHWLVGAGAALLVWRLRRRPA